MENAVTAANNAFQGWSNTPKETRSALLNTIATLIESRLDEFAAAESADQGKPVSLAKMVE